MEKNSSALTLVLKVITHYAIAYPTAIISPLWALHLKGQLAQWVKSMGSGTRLPGWASWWAGEPLVSCKT